MTAPAEIKDIDQALHVLQGKAARGEIVVRKTRDGQVGNQRTKYADLVEVNTQVLAALNELDCVWKCLPTIRTLTGPNGTQSVVFVLAYSLKHVPSGTAEEGDYPLPNGANPMQNGSAITYGRRYALLAVTGIAAEDDDDDGAGYRGRGTAQRANVRPEPQPRQEPTAQRAQPPARRERARPAEQPPLPEPRTASPAGLPAGDAVRGRGGLITEPMTRKLAIVMREVIGDNPADHRQFIKDMVGREVATRKDLTFDEGRAVIDAFEKAKKTENPILSVIDIYRRTTGGEPDAPRQSVAEQTRASVVGAPAGPGDEPPPWDTNDQTTPGGN